MTSLVMALAPRDPATRPLARTRHAATAGKALLVLAAAWGVSALVVSVVAVDPVITWIALPSLAYLSTLGRPVPSYEPTWRSIVRASAWPFYVLAPIADLSGAHIQVMTLAGGGAACVALLAANIHTRARRTRVETTLRNILWGAHRLAGPRLVSTPAEADALTAAWLAVPVGTWRRTALILAGVSPAGAPAAANLSEEDLAVAASLRGVPVSVHTALTLATPAGGFADRAQQSIAEIETGIRLMPRG